MKKNLSLTFLLLGILGFTYAQSTTLTLPTSNSSSNFNVLNSTGATIMQVNGDAGFYLEGTYGTGTLEVTGAGTRMMWYPAKAAFRAGRVIGTEWDNDNIGVYSTALGLRTTASKDGTTAMGFLSTASGVYSTAMGSNTTASGALSTAFGEYTTASGFGSTALGENTRATGPYSTSMGAGTWAEGEMATSMGTGTKASGKCSTAMGYYTTSQAYTSLAIGRYNIVEGDGYNWISTEPLFVCGNGSNSSSSSNALTLLKNGNLTIAGTLTENSDIRLKEEILPLKDVLSSLQNITPIYYRFKDKKTHPADRQIGFSAQEIEKEFPELVLKDSKGYLSVDYSHVTAVLLQAIKEQQEIISKQSEEIAGLKQSFEEMKTLVAGIADEKETSTGILQK